MNEIVQSKITTIRGDFQIDIYLDGTAYQEGYLLYKYRFIVKVAGPDNSKMEFSPVYGQSEKENNEKELADNLLQKVEDLIKLERFGDIALNEIMV